MSRVIAVNRGKAASREGTPTHSRVSSRAASREAVNYESVEEEVLTRLHVLDNCISLNNNGNDSNLLSPTSHQHRDESGRPWYNSRGNLTSSDSSPTSDNTTDSERLPTQTSPHSEQLHTTLGFCASPNDNTTGNCLYRMPIVGYEVLEDRSRFTVFKIQVFHEPSGDQWFVFRRYTDFVRLNKRLQSEFPGLRFALPPKRWFGDNFDPIFLEDRQIGLQAFINNIISHTRIRERKCVRDFFCLDDPPGPHDTLEESRAMCQTLEDSVAELQEQLREKDGEINVLRSQVSFLMAQQHTLVKALRLECELKENEADHHGSTHDLNVALLNICEKSIEDGLGTTTHMSRNGTGCNVNRSIDTTPVHGPHNRLNNTKIKSPLRRTLEKAFLTRSASVNSVPISAASDKTAAQIQRQQSHSHFQLDTAGS